MINIDIVKKYNNKEDKYKSINYHKIKLGYIFSLKDNNLVIWVDKNNWKSMQRVNKKLNS